MEVVGQVISGGFGEILIREKEKAGLELGELLVAEGETKTLLQVYNLLYGSQIKRESLELLSGMQLEGYGSDVGFMEANLRNYILAEARAIASIKDNSITMPKTLPSFFSKIRRVTKEDLSFLSEGQKPMFVGYVRSGSKNLGMEVNLNGSNVLTHHILIPATTGRGKSNLLKIMAWSLLDKDYCGLLILDPHDEYYGRNGPGLKDHPDAADLLMYYTIAPGGSRGYTNLIINLSDLKPWHLSWVLDLSDPQREALFYFYKQNEDEWIKGLLTAAEGLGGSQPPIHVETLYVLKRKLGILGVRLVDGELVCEGVFSVDEGKNTINGIITSLEAGKTVIVDTSSLPGEVELLISSIIADKLFYRYQSYKRSGDLRSKPVVSIVLEEAPRVLGREVLKSGSNIFSTIAREGRKFKIGLIAVTQLPSLIPREILANMNTKIILGIEMEQERRAVIESASQDLSKDDRSIASLDKGEGIITSNFTRFALPVSIPLFDRDYISRASPSRKRRVAETDFSEFR